MTTHRTGTMARRGTHARDTGSTTGIATAVLALLSAGTLASLGLVTADELRGDTPGSVRAPYNDLLPPEDVVVTPAAPSGPGSGPGGGGGGSQPAPGPFELAAVTGGVDGNGPTLSASGPGEAEVTPPTVAPTPPAPPAPVFSSLDPAPTVLAAKHGKAGHAHAHAAGQAKKAIREAREDMGPAAAATPTSLTFLGVAPTAAAGRHPRPEHGRPADVRSGNGRAAHRPPVPLPAVPGAVPAPVTPPGPLLADPSGPGNGHGHGYGHVKV